VQPDRNEEPLKIEVREAIAEVRKTVFGQEEVSPERIRIRPFVTSPATISVKAGFTKNLGSYESARVDVFLSMPCYSEEIDDVYEQVKGWVDARVEKLWLEFEDAKKTKK
jgi:hypothetical protein